MSQQGESSATNFGAQEGFVGQGVQLITGDGFGVPVVEADSEESSVERVYALFESCSKGPSFGVVQEYWFDVGSEEANFVFCAEAF